MPPLRQPRPAVLAAAVLAACLASLWALSAIGSAGRVHGPGRPASEAGDAVQVVRTARELHAVLERRGGRGRVVVSASAYLHFEEPDLGAFWSAQDAFPLRAGDLVPVLDERVDERNHLWLALRVGIAREVVHVVPRPVLLEKEAAARAQPTDVVSVGDGAVTLHQWGSRRTITGAVPALAEPVILEVDASYFELGDPASLARELAAARLPVDLVTLCLAEDNPAVSARARDGLATFAALIHAGAAGAR